jgi:hypothetical protein
MGEVMPGHARRGQDRHALHVAVRVPVGLDRVEAVSPEYPALSEEQVTELALMFGTARKG